MTPDDVGRIVIFVLCLPVMLPLIAWNMIVTVGLDLTRARMWVGFGLFMAGTGVRNAIGLGWVPRSVEFVMICLQVGGLLAIAYGFVVTGLSALTARRAVRRG